MEAPELIDDKWLKQIRDRMQAGFGDPDHVSRRAAELTLAARRMTASVGELPPQPSTLRGRGGRVLVALVRRTLFWYTPQIARAMEALAHALDEQMRAIEVITKNHELSDARIAALELELAALRDHCHRAHCDPDR